VSTFLVNLVWRGAGRAAVVRSRGRAPADVGPLAATLDGDGDRAAVAAPPARIGPAPPAPVHLAMHRDEAAPVVSAAIAPTASAHAPLVQRLKAPGVSVPSGHAPAQVPAAGPSLVSHEASAEGPRPARAAAAPVAWQAAAAPPQAPQEEASEPRSPALRPTAAPPAASFDPVEVAARSGSLELVDVSRAPVAVLPRPTPAVVLAAAPAQTIARPVSTVRPAISVRPAPVPAPGGAAMGAHAQDAAPSPERVVHVRIGTIEIHDDKPAPAALPPSPPAAAGALTPAGGDFDRFARLRSYAPWEH
jgi:hypothetical protein